MTNEKAKTILEAKLECLKRDISGRDIDCNCRRCDECELCYEQGNMGDQIEAIDIAIKALEDKGYEQGYAEGYLEGVEAGFELMKSKKLLNSVYGCFAQNPIMDELNLDFEPLRHITLKETREQKEEILNEYYNRRSSFLHYPIARLLLYEFITLIVYDQVLYCDTDSIFYISSPEIEARIEARNKEKEKKAGA